MKILQNKKVCIAIGANIMFCITLYIYLVYSSEFLYIHYGSDLQKGIEVELTYIFFALLVPLMISVIFSSISLRKKEGWKGVLTFNFFFSIFFMFFTSIWFIFHLIVWLVSLFHY